MKHKHHIIPRHMGGTNDPENLISLTPEEHAEAHRILYENYGKIEDYLAWKGLLGFVGKEDIIKELMRENGKRVGKRMLEEKKEIFDEEKKKSEKYKDGIRRGGETTGKMMVDSGHCKKIASLGGGKNKGKKYWFNEKENRETVSEESPGEGWVFGVNYSRINLDSLRENCRNREGTFWVTNEETGETKMILKGEEIPKGFIKGRKMKKENIIEIHNTSEEKPIKGIPYIRIKYKNILFNPGNLRWEFIKRGENKIKVSHTDYYGLVWFRDCFINFYNPSEEKSKFNFKYRSLEEPLKILRDWREYHLISKILEDPKLKKSRKEFYGKKLLSVKINYDYLEEKRKRIIIEDTL